MKTLALFAALLACACASSPTAVIDQRTLRCDEPGHDIEVAAGLDDGTSGRATEQTGQRAYLVNVTNNSHGEVTVKSIRVDPNDHEGSMDNVVTRSFNQTIPENDEHLFLLPINATWTREMIERHPTSGWPFEFGVSVVLANGDAYRCDFQVQFR
jgi:hypothetical protein